METNKRKKKSGSEGRKLKKMRLAEEAKSRVQMEQYFVKKTPVKEKGIEKPGTSLLSNNQSRVDLETNIMQSSGSDEEEQITTENVNTEITLPLDTDSGQTDIAISSNVAETSNTPGIDEFDHVNFDDVPEDIPTVDRGHLDKEKETSSSDFENVFNVSAVLERNLTHEEKIECLNQKPCQPSRDELKKRKKVIGGIERHCSEDMFFRKDERGVKTNRSWLTYSLDKDALFCIPCLLFSDEILRGENQRHNQGKAFCKDGFSNWKKQYNAIPDHETSQAHMNAKLSQVMFLQQRSLNDILKRQDEEQEKKRLIQVEANRRILKRVIETIMFLGKQELAFRGHRESLASDSSVNKGNFLETLKYLAEYDDVMALHLESVERDHIDLEAKKKGKKKGDKARRFGRGSKLTFLSNDMQNKIIDVISKEIAKEIVNLVKDSVAWAVIADTTPDVSKHEQFSLCVRVVTKSGEVSEHLLFCTRTGATTAEALVNKVEEEMTRLDVPFDNVVAQTYDGASNMSGKYNGLQAKFKEIAGEHVIFVHCYAHNLNLVLSDAATASLEVEKLFDNLQALYVMVSRSQPIHQLFEDCQKQLKEESIRSLKRIDTVRWSAREFSLDIFVKRYDSIMLMLQKIVDDNSYKSDKRSTADGMLKLFSTKQFLATALLFKEIFSITGPLSRKLQSVNIDFGSALTLLKNAEEQLETLRKDPQQIIDAVDLNFEGAEWEQKRIVRSRRISGAGETAVDKNKSTESIDPEAKWRIDVFTVALDYVTVGLDNRFSDSKHVLEAFSIFSPRAFPTFFTDYPTTNHVEEKVREFCNTYKIDVHRCAAELFSFAKVFEDFDLGLIQNKSQTIYLDSDIDYLSDDEVEIDDEEDASGKFKSFMDCLSVLTNKNYMLIDAYPNLVRVYSIAVAIPITSCSAERSFSTLKRVKTRLRSSMLQDRLEGLLLMSIERKILSEIDVDKIMDIVGQSSSELKKALL